MAFVAAVVGAFVTEVADRSEAAVGRLAGGSPAFAELAELLGDIVQASATNHAVKAAAQALNADIGESDDIDRARTAVSALLDAARADRTIRTDLSIDDFYLLVSSAPADQPPEVLVRWVDLILFGITGPEPSGQDRGRARL